MQVTLFEKRVTPANNKLSIIDNIPDFLLSAGLTTFCRVIVHETVATKFSAMCSALLSQLITTIYGYLQRTYTAQLSFTGAATICHCRPLLCWHLWEQIAFSTNSSLKLFIMSNSTKQYLEDGTHFGIFHAIEKRLGFESMVVLTASTWDNGRADNMRDNTEIYVKLKFAPFEGRWH